MSYTNQEVFDKVYAWLTRPNFVRCTDGHICRYTDGKDNACAIGILLPEDLRKRMPAYGILSVMADLNSDVRRELHELFQNVDRNLLHSLQSAHDHADRIDPRSFLRGIAKVYNLNAPKENQEF